MKVNYRKAVALIGASTLLVLSSGVARADNLHNDIVTTGEVVAVDAGDPATVGFWIAATGGGNDSQNGCNAADGTSARVTFQSTPAGVTLPSITFNRCGEGEKRFAQFSSATAGRYVITASVSDGGAGAYNVDRAAFVLDVTDPNAAPELSLPGSITEEATSSTGATVSFIATADDAEDGTLAPTCSPASGTAFGLGTTTVDCSVTDSGGKSDTGSFDVLVQDTTAPAFESIPGNQTVEAVGPSGATATWETPTATDAVDGPSDVSCDPSPGTFGLGSHTVVCTAGDTTGNASTASFTINVQDTTAPAFTGTPANQILEATGPSGATATWVDPQANDLVDGSRPVSCSPASGTTFALDQTTTVSCSASDTRGNANEIGFTIKVEDTTAPALDDVPSDQTIEAAGPSGAVATWTGPSATDAVDGSVTPVCSAASGDVFSLGTTTVSCSATDAHNNVSDESSFTITVQDTTGPALSGVPQDQIMTATSPSGATAAWDAPMADDLVDGVVAVACDPASGTTFPIGSTTVTCSATDATGNPSSATFRVRVVYDWTGFFSPVNNPNVLNAARAGSAIPVKFSLHGDMGMDVFTTGYPRSVTMTCDNTAPLDAIEATVTAGASTLSYDGASDTYTYVWKTDKTWAGSCRQVVVKLNDGTYYRALFKLTK